MPLDVDLVELARDRRDEVLLHLDRHVLRQDGEQEALLKGEKATMTITIKIMSHTDRIQIYILSTLTSFSFSSSISSLAAMQFLK